MGKPFKDEFHSFQTYRDMAKDCNDNNIQSWDSNFDFRLVYSGNQVSCEVLNFGPDDNVRDVLMQLGNAVCELSGRYIPAEVPVIIDEDVNYQTTGAELNSKYPGLVLGSVVHNNNNSKFTKLSPSKWQYEIIDLR